MSPSRTGCGGSGSQPKASERIVWPTTAAVERKKRRSKEKGGAARTIRNPAWRKKVTSHRPPLPRQLRPWSEPRPLAAFQTETASKSPPKRAPGTLAHSTAPHDSATRSKTGLSPSTVAAPPRFGARVHRHHRPPARLPRIRPNRSELQQPASRRLRWSLRLNTPHRTATRSWHQPAVSGNWLKSTRWPRRGHRGV